jgi:hypothetical protein
MEEREDASAETRVGDSEQEQYHEQEQEERRGKNGTKATIRQTRWPCKK